MSKDIKHILEQNYTRIGPLTAQQFLAVKSLNQRMIYAQDVNLGNLKRVDAFGRESSVTPDQIRIGDTIKLQATVRNMAGGPEKTGALRIENINDAQFDPKTGFLLIDSDKFCLASVDCQQEIQDLAVLINAPDVWVTRNTLNEIIPQETTLSEFEEVRDLKERKIELDIGFDSLDGFEEFSQTDSFAGKDEIQQPDLLF